MLFPQGRVTAWFGNIALALMASVLTLGSARAAEGEFQPLIGSPSFDHCVGDKEYWSLRDGVLTAGTGAALDQSKFLISFDLFPEKTVEYMQSVKRPWIAFKVLAGGAIPPPDGFKFAFENGADFLCVGMLDFQIVEDVNIALDVLANVKSRPRPWCA